VLLSGELQGLSVVSIGWIKQFCQWKAGNGGAGDEWGCRLGSNESWSTGRR